MCEMISKILLHDEEFNSCSPRKCHVRVCVCMHVQIIDMAGKGDSSFAMQLMSGLMSDLDTASVVLNHTSADLFRRIDNDGIDSLLDSELLERQLSVILSCLRVLSCHKDSRNSESCDGSPDSYTEQCTSVSYICTSLLDSLCYPLLDHYVTNGVSSDYNHRSMESVLSVLVPCFTSAARETQMKVLRVLITLLSHKEMSSFYLPLVGILSQLYECPDSGAVAQTTTDDLLSAVEQLCLSSEEPFVGQILVELVPSVLTHHEHREAVIARLWSTVERFYSAADVDRISRCCFLICGLVNVLFTPGNASVLFSANLLSSSTLWYCVQKGLQHTEALSRKRAIFVLRRALDFAGMINDSAESTAVRDLADVLNSAQCLCRLSSVWREVIILFETLEEKQVSCLFVCPNADSICSLSDDAVGWTTGH